MSKPLVIFFIFFMTVMGMHSQIKTGPIDLELQDVSIPEGLNKLAGVNGFRVFYQKEWFSDEKVSRQPSSGICSQALM